ncbi:MAG: hypothetical protein LBP36_01235 [Oscillospiraceae bacterium]|jgi:hypothetical protein|nr:hypothetical protein [Oscillospiraceae bacterium]
MPKSEMDESLEELKESSTRFRLYLRCIPRAISQRIKDIYLQLGLVTKNAKNPLDLVSHLEKLIEVCRKILGDIDKLSGENLHGKERKQLNSFRTELSSFSEESELMKENLKASDLYIAAAESTKANAKKIPPAAYYFWADTIELSKNFYLYIYVGGRGIPGCPEKPVIPPDGVRSVIALEETVKFQGAANKITKILKRAVSIPKMKIVAYIGIVLKPKVLYYLGPWITRLIAKSVILENNGGKLLEF